MKSTQNTNSQEEDNKDDVFSAEYKNVDWEFYKEPPKKPFKKPSSSFYPIPMWFIVIGALLIGGHGIYKKYVSVNRAQSEITNRINNQKKPAYLQDFKYGGYTIDAPGQTTYPFQQGQILNGNRPLTKKDSAMLNLFEKAKNDPELRKELEKLNDDFKKTEQRRQSVLRY